MLLENISEPSLRFVVVLKFLDANEPASYRGMIDPRTRDLVMKRMLESGLAGAMLIVASSGLVVAEEIDPALAQAIRAKAAETLLDPYSAVFTYDVIKLLEEGAAGKICGSVNAKNGFGAYTGARFFYAGYMRTVKGYEVIAFSMIRLPFQQVMDEHDFCS